MAKTNQGLRATSFSTDGYEARHRFDAWCAEFGTLNDILIPREERPGFEARCAAWRLGPFTIAASATPAMGLSRGPRHTARDSLDHWVLRVARDGRVRSRLGDACFEAAPRQLVAYSVAEGFEGEWSPAEWVTLWIPRDASSAVTARLSLWQPGPQSGVGAALLADLLLSLPDHLLRAEAAEEEGIVAAIGGLIAARLPDSPAEARDTAANPLLRERVRRVIRANIGSARLTPARIARAAGLSRSALYRIMEAEGGVAHYVQRQRLGLVHAALGDPHAADRSIASLAEKHGFHDASAFTRAFRRTYGCTPSDVRHAALMGAPLVADRRGPLRPDAGAERGGALSALLRGMAG
jgi:AraC-like DNA-binding protein